MYMCTFWMYTCMCVHVCGEQSSISGTVPQVLPILFFETESPLCVELITCGGLAVPTFPVLHSPVPG